MNPSIRMVLHTSLCAVVVYYKVNAGGAKYNLFSKSVFVLAAVLFESSLFAVFFICQPVVGYCTYSLARSLTHLSEKAKFHILNPLDEREKEESFDLKIHYG